MADPISAKHNTSETGIYGPTDAQDRSTRCGAHQLVRSSTQSRRDPTRIKVGDVEQQSYRWSERGTKPNQADGRGEVRRERGRE